MKCLSYPKIKCLIPPDLILEYTLKRVNPADDLLEKLNQLLIVLTKSKNVEGHITSQGLDEIYRYCSIRSQEKAEKIVDHLKTFLKVVDCCNSPNIFETARQCNGDFGKAVELSYFLEHRFIINTRENGFHGFITEQPVKYTEITLPQKYNNINLSLYLWSIEDLINKDNLEKHLKLEEKYFDLPKQLLLPYMDKKGIFNYRIRNRSETVIPAFNLLRKSGHTGLRKQDFFTHLKATEKTGESIILDLVNLKMAETYCDRITVHKNLLDTGSKEISQYLNSVLKEYKLFKEVYKYLSSGDLLNQWGLDEIIADTYSDKKIPTKKSIGDYRSRVISWFIFAKLIEAKSYGKGNMQFTLASSRSYEKSAIKIQQLELRLELETSCI